jgi:hypothetical protein
VTPWQLAEIELAISKEFGEYEKLELIGALRTQCTIATQWVAKVNDLEIMLERTVERAEKAESRVSELESLLGEAEFDLSNALTKNHL